MAIAKVQYKENASATPDVWMDTTQKTVTSGSMLSGTTALKNDGTGITGNIASKSSSDLTASGATVTAPAGYYASAASKSVTSGSAGTPTATKGTVSNHSVSVTPSVTNTTGYITGSTKTGTAVTVSASELVSGTKTISASGTTDVTNYASASVAAGTEGTPTATKSAVSNHSLTVTPSVTNTGGYISGGTKTGTAVTVDVTELESGTKSITENGTGISVSGYSAVDVSVSGGTPNIQSLNVTQNGTYTASGGVDGYSPVTVSVSGGGNVTIETGTYTPSEDTANPTISFSKTYSKLPVFAAMVDSDGYISTSNSNVSWYYVNWEQLIGGAVYPSTSSVRYGELRYSYRGTNESSLSSATGTVTNSESNTGASSNSYPRFSVNESEMMPYTSSTSRYWKAGRTYKWMAVWFPTT